MKKTRIFFWKLILYSFFGMLWAIFLLWPSTIEHSFVSWVVWMVALTNLFKQNNQWAENKNYIWKELTIEELTETYQQKISN